MIQLYTLSGGMVRLDHAPITSLIDLFSNPPDVGQHHTNVFYTLHDCKTGDREFNQVVALAFDIDGVTDPSKWEAYLSTVTPVAPGSGIPNWTVVSSGNGLHLIMLLDAQSCWSDEALFTPRRMAYRGWCAAIADRLGALGLPGKVDTAIFDKARVLRLPGTLNSKPGKLTARCHTLHMGLTQHPMTWPATVVQPPRPSPIAGIDDWHGALDKTGILEGCALLKQAAEDGGSLGEPLWYAVDSIVGRLPGGRDLIHQWSASHPSYDHAKVDSKITQALEASGPRTCESIHSYWDGCKTCPNYGKVKSPIKIQSDDFIPTSESGFHSTSLTATGLPKLKPEHEDLVKQFKKDNAAYITQSPSCMTFTYTGTHYKYIPDIELQAYAHTKYLPKPDTKTTQEFKNRIQRTEVRPMEWFSTTTAYKLNLKNGVYDLLTGRLSPHSKEYGFRNTINCVYDPEALSPMFDKFMDDITCGDKELQLSLLQYMAYAISGEKCVSDKLLILTGEGANGKTTFVEIMRAIFGKSMVDMSHSDLENQFALIRLEGALCCVMEETPSYKNVNFWEKMKNYSSGGTITASEKGKPVVNFENVTKFVLTCNKLPGGTEASYGYYRRLLVIPFEATFTEETKDVGLRARIIQNELPGVLNRLLDAYAGLSKNLFKLEIPAKSQAITNQYLLDHDTVANWISETIVAAKPGDNFQNYVGQPEWYCADTMQSRPVLLKSLYYAEYLRWAKESNFTNSSIYNVVQFWKRFNVLFQKKRTVFASRYRKNGVLHHVIIGVIPVDLLGEMRCS